MITIEEFYIQQKEYLDNKDGNCFGIRFGQFFCNKMNIHDPELFYMTKLEECISYILAEYVNYE